MALHAVAVGALLVILAPEWVTVLAPWALFQRQWREWWSICTACLSCIDVSGAFVPQGLGCWPLTAPLCLGLAIISPVLA